jgi:6-phosphogluconolactonase
VSRLLTAPLIERVETPEALADRAAHWLAERIAATPGRFVLNLSGGSTPKALFERLTHDDLRQRIDWTKLHLFWGDERFVPFDHKDSNYRMAREALISHVPIPSGQIHPVPTEGTTPEQAAALYEATLQSFYGSKTLDADRSLFDVTLLGMGPDGHTASLFPGTAALDEHKAWVTSIIGAKPEARISMTYPILAASRAILFLVAGAEKKDVLQKVLAGERTFPAARVETKGELIWFVDRAAYP